MKKTLIFIICVLFCLPLFAIDVEEDVFLAAMDAYNKKDFAAAKPLLADYLEKFPKGKYTAVARLKSAELEQDFDRAADSYEEIAAIYHDTEYEAEAVFALGRLFYAKGDYKKAAEYFNIISTRFANNVITEEATYYLMLSYYAAKRFEDTAKLHSQVANNTNFYSFRPRMDLVQANMLFDTGHFEEAAELYKSVIEKSSEKELNIYMPAVYLKLVLCYRNMTDKEKEEETVKDLKYKFPGSREAKFSLTPEPTAEPTKEAAKPAATPVKQQAAGEKDWRTTGFYTVQIGAFTNEKFAKITYEKMKQKKYDTYYRKSGSIIKLQVGKFRTKGEADAFAEKFAKAEKITSYLVKWGTE